MLDQLMQMLMGGVDPALGATMANNPDAIAQHLAQKGVAPPDLSQGADGGDLPMGAQPTSGMGIFGNLPSMTPGAPQSLGGARRPPAPPMGGVPSTLQGQSAADLEMSYDPLAAPTPAPAGVPMPTPRPTPGISFGGAGAPREGTPDAMRGAPQAQAPGGDLLKSLQGIKAPEAPQAQRVSTPAAPRPNALPANNNLVQLLAAALGNPAASTNPLYLQNALGIQRGTTRR